jgi:hypothetical protein
VAHPDTIAVADEQVASPEAGGVLDWLERHYLTGAAAR